MNCMILFLVNSYANRKLAQVNDFCWHGRSFDSIWIEVFCVLIAAITLYASFKMAQSQTHITKGLYSMSTTHINHMNEKEIRADRNELQLITSTSLWADVKSELRTNKTNGTISPFVFEWILINWHEPTTTITPRKTNRRNKNDNDTTTTANFVVWRLRCTWSIEYMRVLYLETRSLKSNYTNIATRLWHFDTNRISQT